MFKKKKMKETMLAYQRLFDSPDGKVVLKDLFLSCHMINSTMDNTSLEMAFNEGARSVVLRILKTCNTKMESLEKFISELEQGEYDE